MYSNGPLHMAEKKQDDQLEHTYSSYVRIRDVALKICRRRWTIGRSGERGPGISVLAARHDYYYFYYCTPLRAFHTSVSRWYSIWAWVTTSLLKSPGFFSVFWPILIAIVWTVSSRALISNTSSPCTSPFVAVLSAPITIGITVTFMFHSFFNSLARSRYLFFFSLSFSFSQWSAGTASLQLGKISFSFFFFYYFKVWSSGRD